MPPPSGLPQLGSSRHIRLLELSLPSSRRKKPAQPLADILTRIVTCSIDEAPAFHALSYVWGSDVPSTKLVLPSGQAFFLTRSLARAIPFVAHQCTVPHLWIDQICINQRDNAEKSQQVGLMGDIYSRCENVIIWLGEAIEHSSLLKQVLDQLHPDTQISAFRNFSEDRAFCRRSLQFRTLSNRLEDDTKGLESLTKLLVEVFRMPWFTRTWVMQEAVLAPRAILVIGYLAFSPLQLYEILALACKDRIYSWPQALRADNRISPRPFLHMLELRDLQGALQMKFEDLLFTQRFYMARGVFRASEPRDYIYGILGLASDANKLSVHPNYGLSIAQTFVEAARAVIINRKDLHVLNYCDGTPSKSRDNADEWQRDLPSWVPDWSTTILRTVPSLENNRLKFGPDLCRSVEHCRPNDWRHFEVRGTLLGTVHRQSYGILPAFRDVFLDTVELVSLTQMSRSQSVLHERLKELACLDNDPLSEPDLFDLIMRWTSRNSRFIEHFSSRVYSMFQDRQSLIRSNPDGNPDYRSGLREAFLTGADVTLQEYADAQCTHCILCHLPFRMDHACEECSIYFFNAGVGLCSTACAANTFLLNGRDFGVADQDVAINDQIFLLDGYDLPVVLRQRSDMGYRYVASCMVAGVGSGEETLVLRKDDIEVRLA